MRFLMKMVDKALIHPFILVDPSAPSSMFTRYLASMFMDYCRIVQIGMPTNFYLPSPVSHDGMYGHICGIGIIYDDSLLKGGETFEYFLSKYGKEWNDEYFLVMACSSKNGLFGIIKK